LTVSTIWKYSAVFDCAGEGVAVDCAAAKTVRIADHDDENLRPDFLMVGDTAPTPADTH
jgi:hypothetical protein